MARLARGESTGPAGYQKYMVYSEDIWEMRKLKPYLCAMACPGGKRTDEVVAETCRKCGNCGYGKQFVMLFDRQKGAETVAAAKKAADEATMQEQLEKKIKETADAKEQLEQKTAQLEKARKEANDAKTQLEQKNKENRSLSVRLESQEKKAKELVEKLTLTTKENEELSEHIGQMSRGLQELGRKLEAADARNKENLTEIKALTLTILKLKAAIYDLEHEEE